MEAEKIEAEEIRFSGFCTYQFSDCNNLPIPNALGYKAIRIIKGHTNIFHDIVADELKLHDREDLWKLVTENERDTPQG